MSKKGWETIWVECSREMKNGGKCGRWDQKYIKSDEAARLRKTAYVCTECRITELEEINMTGIWCVGVGGENEGYGGEDEENGSEDGDGV